jgi:hypothetical protein
MHCIVLQHDEILALLKEAMEAGFTSKKSEKEWQSRTQFLRPRLPLFH